MESIMASDEAASTSYTGAALAAVVDNFVVAESPQIKPSLQIPPAALSTETRPKKPLKVPVL
jgi:hypothetical protein